jgi:hypothetical protein
MALRAERPSIGGGRADHRIGRDGPYAIDLVTENSAPAQRIAAITFAA